MKGEGAGRNGTDIIVPAVALLYFKDYATPKSKENLPQSNGSAIPEYWVMGIFKGEGHAPSLV